MQRELVPFPHNPHTQPTSLLTILRCRICTSDGPSLMMYNVYDSSLFTFDETACGTVRHEGSLVSSSENSRYITPGVLTRQQQQFFLSATTTTTSTAPVRHRGRTYPSSHRRHCCCGVHSALSLVVVAYGLSLVGAQLGKARATPPCHLQK